MKIATGIISLVLMLIIGVQSCAVGVGGSIINNTGDKQGGSVGLLVALLFLIAGAFSFAKPFVSMIFFVIAAILGWAVGATTGYSDMTVWGFVSLVLGIMSFFAWFSERRKKKNAEQQEHSIKA